MQIVDRARRSLAERLEDNLHSNPLRDEAFQQTTRTMNPIKEGEMRMSKCAILMLVAMSIAAVAAAKEGKSIVLQESATVAGHQLKSGDYNVTWQERSPGATVTFRRDGKVKATAEAKLVDRDKKYSSTEVVFGMTADGSRQIQEIRFRGSTQVLVFTE